ncbi:MAG: hypothetical protein ACETVR_00205, partial [Candidatus Bathyarchaeia archaeon]
PLLPLIPSLLVASLLYLTWTNCRVLAYVKRREPLTCLLVAALSSLFALNLLFREGIMWTHDLTGNSLGFLPLFRHVVWSTLRFPRWIHEAWCGVPCLRFYPPLVSWVSALIPLLNGLGIVKFVLAASFFLSAVSMYCTTLSLLGDRYAASFAALCYTLSGYHLLDCFIRGDLTESLSFLWLPLIYLLLKKSLEGDNHRRRIFAGLTLSLLILTHVLIGLLEILWLLLYVALRITFKRVRREEVCGIKELLKPLKVFGITLSVSLALSAFFLLPALLELRYATISTYGFSDYFYLLNHFLSPLQLLRRTQWSVSQFPLESPKLPMYLGNIILFTAFSSLFLVERRDTRFLSLYTSGVALFFLPTSLALPLVRLVYIPPISTVLSPLQFPWRLFTVLAFVSSLLAGYTIRSLHRRLAGKTYLSRLLFLLLLLALLVDMQPYTGAVRWEGSLQLDEDVDAALRWVSGQEGIYRVWCSEAPYYTILSNNYYPLLLDGPFYDWKPVGSNLMFHALGELTSELPLNFTNFLSVKYVVTRNPSRYERTVVERRLGEVYVLRTLDFRPFFEVLDGVGEILSGAVESRVIVERFSEERMKCRVEIYVPSPTGRYFLTVKESFFPGWRARVNGEWRSVMRTTKGLMTVEVPQGISEVEFIFTRTPPEICGNVISLVTILAVVLYLLRKSAIPLYEQRKKGERRV